mmetsp:Transcript_3489/g.9296  ORF Transcript_3489/g.9296 Transcript_3489/m.9296 type:complete len:112 (-) Transcript_3489:404-739(-)
MATLHAIACKDVCSNSISMGLQRRQYVAPHEHGDIHVQINTAVFETSTPIACHNITRRHLRQRFLFYSAANTPANRLPIHVLYNNVHSVIKPTARAMQNIIRHCEKSQQTN